MSDQPTNAKEAQILQILITEHYAKPCHLTKRIAAFREMVARLALQIQSGTWRRNAKRA
jgi:hypothetical protein